VGVGGQADLGQGLGRHAVVVQELRRQQGVAHHRRGGAEGCEVGHLPRRRRRRAGLAEAAAPALVDRAEHHDVAGLAGAHGGVGEEDGRRPEVAPAAPGVGAEAEVPEAERGGEPGVVAAAVHERDEPVDVRQAQPGVLDRRPDGGAGELEGVVR
jgi:hypothetical protein